MKKQILEVLNLAAPGVDFIHNSALIDDGILQSINIISIVSELSVEFDVNFSFEDLTPENFNSLDRIVALVEKKLG